MAKTLDVYLHKDLFGRLVQDGGGQMVFDYAGSWSEKSDACPLSQFLLLRKKHFTRKECSGLPGQGNRMNAHVT